MALRVHWRRFLRVLLIVAGLGAAAITPVGAQGPDGPWGQPVNLSQSGAASAPQIVAEGEALQAFWWDEVDGLTTALYQEGEWSNPVAAPLRSAVQVAEEEFVLVPVDVMPAIVSDGAGWLQAIWIGEPDRETGVRSLMRGRMRFGETVWSPAAQLAESAVSFQVASSPTGDLAIAYVRPSNSEAYPAGIYVKTMRGGEAEWSAPAGAYQSAYLRTATDGEAHLWIAAGREDDLYLGWNDPRSGHARFAYSLDSGATWSEAGQLGERADAPTRPRVFALPDGGVLRVWEAVGPDGCTLRQQSLGSGDRENTGWSEPARVLPDLGECPSGFEGMWPRGEVFIWAWGQGTSALTLVAWDVGRAEWSRPLTIGLGLDDPATGRRIAVDDLHIVRLLDRLAVVGVAAGDVWAVQSQVDPITFAFAPPSPWSAPVWLSGEQAWCGWPAAAVDGGGSTHIVWPESTQAAGAGTVLYCAQLSAARARFSRPFAIIEGAPNEEMVRQPALVVDSSDVLHLVWSGGPQGEILYSRANAGSAFSAGEWSTPRALPMRSLLGSRPQIAAQGGWVVVAYAVPLNEARGIYVTRSPDGGESWEAPVAVFDAEAAGWAIVDQPSIIVSPDDALHAVWVRAAPPGSWGSQGVYYARASDGETWKEPLRLAGPGSEWPRLAAGKESVHLIYTASDGGAWHRAAQAAEAGTLDGWSLAAQVPGFERAQGPLAVAPGGDRRFHVLGASGDPGEIVHALWDGERWLAKRGLSLGLDGGEVQGIAAASRPAGGLLAVAAGAGLASGEGESRGVVASLREIEVFTASDTRTWELWASGQGEETVGPTEAPAVASESTPAPTLVLEAVGGAPPEQAMTILGPLIAGAGVSAMGVAGLLFVRTMRRRMR